VTEYLHGTDAVEQQRLQDQSNFLKNLLMPNLPFEGRSKLLELGCGVGAQTGHLLDAFPALEIVGVDVSEAQLETARRKWSKESRVSFRQSSSSALPLPDSSFDCAYICWVLEHVPNIPSLLLELRRCLKPGAMVVCTEVLNDVFYMAPQMPETILKVWQHLNQKQVGFRGDPNVGSKLVRYFTDAGFKVQRVVPLPLVGHSGETKELWELQKYMNALLQSALEPKVRAEIGEVLRLEWENWAQNPDAFFMLTPIRVLAAV
jgi:ubiquinone/menaquinone biosynthesis C-methylase UbiE